MGISDILSKDEMAALMHESSKTSRIIMDPASFDGSIETVNIISSHHSHFANFEGFNALNEQYAYILGQSLSKFLGIKVTIEPQPGKVSSYEEYVKQLELPTALHILFIRSHKSVALINFNDALVYWVLEILFGGTVNNKMLPRTEFGRVEEKISLRVLEVVMGSLNMAWQEISGFDYQLVKFVTRPRPIDMAAPKDRLIIFEYQVKLADVVCRFDICFEKSMVDELLPALQAANESAGDVNEQRVWRTKLYESVMDATLPLRAFFPNIKISLQELTNLKEGDVITLDNPNMVFVEIAGIKSFVAHCGNSQGARVIEIVDKLAD